MGRSQASGGGDIVGEIFFERYGVYRKSRRRWKDVYVRRLGPTEEKETRLYFIWPTVYREAQDGELLIRQGDIGGRTSVVKPMGDD